MERDTNPHSASFTPRRVADRSQESSLWRMEKGIGVGVLGGSCLRGEISPEEVVDIGCFQIKHSTLRFLALKLNTEEMSAGSELMFDGCVEQK